MPEDKNDPQDDEIKVSDRRLFGADGERLQQDDPAEAAPPSPDTGDAGPEPSPGSGAPEPSFETLVFGLANAAFIHLGQVRDPAGGETEVDLPAAKEAIDLLGVLQKKTEGNLTPEEHGLLDSLLFKLRIDFSHRATSR